MSKVDRCFNIIFVAGTVRYLRLAVASLLRHSALSFRLVANGLDPQERRLLEAYCETSPRLEYFYYPTRGVLDHGSMLNLLFQREAGDWFCFCDSDIFATGPFQREMEQQLPRCDVFSSCLPVSMAPDSVLRGFSGRCLETPGGRPLAPTYFSAYRMALFRRIVPAVQTGFEVIHPARFLPAAAREQLADEVRQARRLDTGKLLNMLAGARGARFHHRELGNLIHIGGISRMRDSWRDRLTRRLPGRARPFVLDEQLLEREIRRRSRNRRHLANAPHEEEIRSRALRTPLADYFGALLRHLFDGTPKPRFELHDERLRQAVARLDGLLQTLYETETHIR